MFEKSGKMFSDKTYGDHERGKAFTGREYGNVCPYGLFTTSSYLFLFRELWGMDAVWEFTARGFR